MEPIANKISNKENTLNKQIRSTKKRYPQKLARDFFHTLRINQGKEHEIDSAWHDLFRTFFIYNSKNEDHLDFTSEKGIKWDGFLIPHNLGQSLNVMVVSLRLLMEFKTQTEYHGGTLKDPRNRAAIMAQVLHYMKKIKEEGKYQEPNVIFGADEYEAFVVPGKLFTSYLSGNYDWSISPREAFENKDPKLTNALRKDGNMNVFPFQFDRGNFKQKYKNLIDMLIYIENTGSGQATSRLPVNLSNLTDIYSQFKDIAFKPHQKISSVESVNIFMQLITDPHSDNYYINPNNTNKFYANGKTVYVNGHAINAFMSRYNRRIKPSARKKLKGIADRLIRIEVRRYKGDFWTPSIWAHKANDLMNNVISPDYKTTSLIWDCAAGVRNLTRDFSYNDLYISTYHEPEIELGSKFNTSRKAAFQYDFLNDDVSFNPTDNRNPKNWKMPNNLFNELKNASKTDKRVIFYTNPPYGTANNAGAKGTSKKGIAYSKVHKLMKDDKYGASSQQLYAQFFYRIFKIIKDFKLKNVYIGFFTNSRFFSGGKYWEKFNHALFSKFKWENGFIINAGEFSGTAKTWTITFSVYKLRNKPIKNTKLLDDKHYEFDILVSDLDSTNHPYVKKIGTLTNNFVYNNDLTSWPRKYLSKIHNKRRADLDTYPQLSSGLKISSGKNPQGFLYQHSLGYMVSNSDNVASGRSGVWTVTSSAYKGHGLNIMPVTQQFNRSVVTLAARTCIKPTWINAQQNYQTPDVNNKIYSIFVNDSLIYSLFSKHSYQSSFRDKRYTNTGIPGRWANKWFWLSNKYVSHIADDNDNDTIYNDAIKGTDTWVYNQIKTRTFSKEAKAVLNDATQVWKDTFKYRNDYAEEYPDYYLNTWDAGWYQLKLMPKTKSLDSYKQFQKDLKILTKKLANNVYKLGMLTK